MDDLVQAATVNAEISFPLLNECKISQDQAVDFHADFTLVLHNFGLTKPEIRNHPVLTNFKGVPGVYFLVMRLNDCSYKIYAGKARCLLRRLNDYTNGFQIHSPNDYKLRAFRHVILNHEPQTEFDLYFQKSSKDTYTQQETATIKKYDPLLNQRGDGDRNLIQEAFEAYFSQSFKKKLIGLG